MSTQPSLTALLSRANDLLATNSLQKQSGPVSEFASALNPLNAWGGGPVAGLAALLTPTQSLQQQAEFDSSDSPLRALTNLLIPGVGPYRGWKRIGAGIRSPEMQTARQKVKQDKARRELAALEHASGEEKQSGWKTEVAGAFLNPLNLFPGNTLGPLAALLSRTRTLNEQAEADEKTWSNLLVPGQAGYNYAKRIGTATRSPEMVAMRSRAKMDRLRRAAGPADKVENGAEEKEPSKAAAAFRFGEKVALSLDMNHPAVAAGLPSAGLGLLAGGVLGGLADPGETETVDENGKVVRKPRSRLMNALTGAIGGGALMGAGGAAAGYLSPTVADKAREMNTYLRGMLPANLFGQKNDPGDIRDIGKMPVPPRTQAPAGRAPANAINDKTVIPGVNRTGNAQV